MIINIGYEVNDWRAGIDRRVSTGGLETAPGSRNLASDQAWKKRELRGRNWARTNLVLLRF
jgi:hypothetical protein